MTMETDTKKLRLIKQITEIEDQALVDRLEHMVNATSHTLTVLNELDKPIEKKFDLEKIKKEQNFQPINKEDLNKLIQEADIQEPIEELLAMLRT